MEVNNNSNKDQQQSLKDEGPTQVTIYFVVTRISRVFLCRNKYIFAELSDGVKEGSLDRRS